LIKINNIRDYSLGKSSFPTVILVATIFSTYVSARASIADIGLVYSSGLIYGIPLLLSFILFIKVPYFADEHKLSSLIFSINNKIH
jgi:Na+/proline symporter